MMFGALLMVNLLCGLITVLVGNSMLRVPDSVKWPARLVLLLGYSCILGCGWVLATGVYK